MPTQSRLSKRRGSTFYGWLASSSMHVMYEPHLAFRAGLLRGGEGRRLSRLLRDSALPPACRGRPRAQSVSTACTIIPHRLALFRTSSDWDRKGRLTCSMLNLAALPPMAVWGTRPWNVTKLLSSSTCAHTGCSARICLDGSILTEKRMLVYSMPAAWQTDHLQDTLRDVCSGSLCAGRHNSVVGCQCCHKLCVTLRSRR